MLDAVILGAGISGLTAAYTLKKISNGSLTVKLVEKESRAGGWIQTIEKNEFLFDLGPNSIRTSGSGLSALKLAVSLGLQNEIIFPVKESLKRYILHKGRLKSPFFTKGIALSVLKDLFVKKSLLDDESVSNFFSRRFSPSIIDTLVDAFVTGIFAGDSSALSMRYCFPKLFYAEKKHRSLLLSFLLRKKKLNDGDLPSKGPFFSFRRGMQTLTNALQDKVQDSLLFGEEADRIEYNKGWTIYFKSGKTLRASNLVSALPMHALKKLLDPLIPDVDKILMLNSASLAVVPLAFKSNEIDTKKGFGYLVPFIEKSPLLGVIFNGSIFEGQGGIAGTTKMTAMLGGMRNLDLVEKNPEEILSIALQELFRHTQVKPVQPVCSHVHIVKSAIPQYPVGYWKSLQSFKEITSTKLPHFFTQEMLFTEFRSEI